MPAFDHRLASLDDLDDLHALMARAISQLQRDFLDPAQVRASHRVMGLDTQLIRDRTYFVLLDDATIAGCGGWSYRATLYGGDASVVARQRDRLDPTRDAARIRAMYTEPAYARQGVGRRLLALCERAAYEQGFRSAELMATLAGEPLYRSCGYHPAETILSDPIDGVQVPLRRMTKDLTATVPGVGFSPSARRA
jgi:GNAT superfamily N-acetyltransferase